jgi:plastocyanin
MTRISSLASMATTVLALSALACEGEPPKFPDTLPPAPTAGPAPAPEPATTAPSASAAPAATGAPGAPCMPCNCMGEHGAAPSTSASATPAPPAAEGAGAVAAAAAPAAGSPTSVVVGNIVGHVATLPTNAAAHAVVYLEDAPVVPGPTLAAHVDNRQMAFLPYVAVVAAGGRVVFSNGDPFPHNVFSTGKDRFDLGLVQPKSSTAHVFKTAGVYPLLCNLHPNMLGFVVVSPSSYFAKANAKGEFEIKGVPAGTYKITAWAPRQQPATQSVTVSAAAAMVTFDLHR